MATIPDWENAAEEMQSVQRASCINALNCLLSWPMFRKEYGGEASAIKAILEHVKQKVD